LNQFRENNAATDSQIKGFMHEIDLANRQKSALLTELNKTKDHLAGICNESRLLKERLRIFEK
jgi:predicted  nucleic acid-binding Zn-ribbon protein